MDGGRRCAEAGCQRGIVRGGPVQDRCVKHGGGRRCAEAGCQKSAVGATDRCVEHGGGRRCSAAGCRRSASGQSDRCVRHGGGRRCTEAGCQKSGVGLVSRCIEHGGGKRCTTPGCRKGAVHPSETCIEHGGGRRCVFQGCSKAAQPPSNSCIEHGGGKRCAEPGCLKGARHPSNQCIEHGGGKRCDMAGCTKGAQGASNKCKEHGGGARCPNCINWVDSRSGTAKYDGWCATCFKRQHPDDPRSKVIRGRAKELAVRNAIASRFEDFIHDRPLYTSHCDCTHRRRVDHRRLVGNTLLAVETDENAHQNYNQADEELRYNDLYMVHSGKWIYIRFNPDRTRTNKAPLAVRLSRLLEEIEHQIGRIEREENLELVEIIKLYY